MREWVIPLHISMVVQLLITRFSLREGVSGELQPSPRNFFELYSDITAMLTWIWRSKMPSMCKFVVVTILHMLFEISYIDIGFMGSEDEFRITLDILVQKPNNLTANN
ncbi:uncharacterized protein LOC111390246 [Olea europaea var. sylvestris]|uniref:uncharacterized protein LOC111390246 n=1 Tax=Olea europaea var. sylvestris TaxID=158386 RepID=UPI000C1D1F7C|nr:uncharacterized protein LOC111390246 [Olea europaea var. sylvestris]